MSADIEQGLSGRKCVVFFLLLISCPCVHWYCHILRRLDGHVLRGALQFEVVCQRKNGRPNGQGRGRLRKKT